MRLPRAGREYAHFTFTDLPDDAVVEVTVDGTNWHATTGTGLIRDLLVHGPDYTETDSAGSILIAATCIPEARITDNPEVILRKGGTITIT